MAGGQDHDQHDQRDQHDQHDQHDQRDQGDKGDKGDKGEGTGRSWIDAAVWVAKWIGLNPVRVRWKLEGWRRQRAQARRRREQRADHIRYQHKTCDNCGAVQDRDATVCSRCGERLGRRGFQVLRRLGILAPEWLSMSTLLGAAFVLAYARVVVAAGGGLGDLFSLDAPILFEYGGSWAPAVEAGERWRWLTACFLHGGIMHLGFNLFALSVVGPQVEALYGRLQMLFLFVATGVVGFIGSGWAGTAAVGIGASGGLMGLVGVAAGWGHREGTTRGRDLRNDMLKWSAYVFVFGFLIPGIDNWAHFFGLLAGLGFGLAVRPAAWRRPAMAILRAAAGVVGVAAALAALVLIARPPGPEDESAKAMEGFGEVCRAHWQGDDERAIEVARAQEEGPLGERSTAEDVRQVCDELVRALAMCRQGAPPPPDFGSGGDASRTWHHFCDQAERVLGSAAPPPGP